MRVSAVLFDVDGTLIHSQPGIVHAFTYAFTQMGIDPAGIDLSRYLGPPLRQSFARHFSRADQVERAVALYRDHYARIGAHECTLYPGVPELLKTLRDAGIYLCTATSKPVDVVTPILKEMGILGFFDRVGGSSMDASIDTKTAVIENLLQSAPLQKKRCLMVGDRRDDMQGAADHGLPAAAVLYGYGTREELEPFDPVFYAESCPQLAQKILTYEGRFSEL